PYNAHATRSLLKAPPTLAHSPLPLHDALPIWAQQYDHIYPLRIYQYGPNGIRDKQTAHRLASILEEHGWLMRVEGGLEVDGAHRDRKSTRLNSSHQIISYAVFCLKKIINNFIV